MVLTSLYHFSYIYRCQLYVHTCVHTCTYTYMHAHIHHTCVFGCLIFFFFVRRHRGGGDQVKACVTFSWLAKDCTTVLQPQPQRPGSYLYSCFLQDWGLSPPGTYILSSSMYTYVQMDICIYVCVCLCKCVYMYIWCLHGLSFSYLKGWDC